MAFSGVKKAQTPVTIRIMKIFAPTMVPTIISDCPLLDATNEIARSGNEDPTAITEMATINSEMPRTSAKLIAEPIVSHAPIATPRIPRRTNAMFRGTYRKSWLCFL